MPETMQQPNLFDRIDALQGAYERLLESFRAGVSRNLCATPLPFESVTLSSWDEPVYGPARIAVAIEVHRAGEFTYTFRAGSMEAALDAWFASDKAIVGACPSAAMVAELGAR